jgi:copper(I)-binding protein
MRSWPEAHRPARVRGSLASTALVAVLVAVLAACGGGGAGPTSSPGGGLSIVVSDAWVRAPTGVGTLTAGYFTITNTGAAADTLLGVTSPAASSAMVHLSTTSPDGMTAMLPAPRVDVPAGGTVRFEPGGYHVMLEGVAAGLASGATIELDLQFEHAGRVAVQASIRSS